jgi:DNA-binding Lrp family transcriptional regulator
VLDVDCTPPPQGRKGNLPFAAPPHDLVADPRLTPTDVRIAAALLYWARSKASCWPSDATIGKRVGRSPGTVQRSLRRLEAAGWIAREKTAANRTGRLIRLVWRSAGARPLPAPMADPPAAPARDEGERIVKGDTPKESVREISERPRPEPTQSIGSGHRGGATGAPKSITRPWSISAAQKVAWLGSDDPILKAEAERLLAPLPPQAQFPETVLELLARIRESPTNVAAAAEMLCRDLDDRKSWSGFYAACRRAWEGQIPPGALVTAWREATSGRARNPGAVFMAVLRREIAAGASKTFSTTTPT